MASIDYNDERFTQVKNDEQAALNDINNTYDKMISGSDSYYQKLIDAANNYADEQKKNQQAMTDQQIAEVEQQKEQTKKDYEKEQTAAYTDYMKKNNKYGSNAEAMASLGLTNSGFDATNQRAMYTTYQNRVATARDSYSQAIVNYNNSMQNIKLQNSSALAEIAYNALQKQLELSLEGFQYKNTLLLDQLDKQTTNKNTYYSRYQDVVSQINTENSLAESIRQYNENMAYQRERDAVEDAQWQKEYELSVKKANSSSSSGSTNKSYNTGVSSAVNSTSNVVNSAVNAANSLTSISKVKTDYRTAYNFAQTTYKNVLNSTHNTKKAIEQVQKYVALQLSEGNITIEQANKIYSSLGIS